MNLDSLLDIRGGARIRDSLLKLPVVARQRPRAYWFRHRNFGDTLSPVVLNWVTGVRPIWVTRRFEGKILAIGSILHSALSPRDVVWGSGLIRDQALEPPAGVRFQAVRGPLTRSRIRADVPDVYGDPALLLPLFRDNEVKVRYEVGLVPHFLDQEIVDVSDPAIRIIDVLRPWNEVVDDIRSCEAVVSSSLHGLIVAEAYGIPGSWVEISDRVIGGGFKFNDYLLATGREARRAARWELGLAHALRNRLPPLSFDPIPLLEAARNLPRQTDSRTKRN